MAGSQPLVLDDVESALSQLSDFGRPIVRPVVEAVRKAVTIYAAIHGWRLVKHASFVIWAEEEMQHEDCWVVLDPLFPQRARRQDVREVRLSRMFTQTGYQLTAELPADIKAWLSGRSIGVIDDVCGRGLTFRHLNDLVTQAGGKISRFIACTSTEVGTTSIEEVAAHSALSFYRSDDHDTLHLRDGCPGLPFAGRQVSGRLAIESDVTRIPVRVPPWVTGGLWTQLAKDKAVGWALSNARRELAARLSSALGRPAIVSDVPLLGPNVAVMLYLDQPASFDTLLGAVLK